MPKSEPTYECHDKAAVAIKPLTPTFVPELGDVVVGAALGGAVKHVMVERGTKEPIWCDIMISADSKKSRLEAAVAMRSDSPETAPTTATSSASPTSLVSLKPKPDALLSAAIMAVPVAPSLSDDTRRIKRIKIHSTNTIHQCEQCGKVYKHRNCLAKHRWEHHESWESTRKLCATKHQQVQLLEAAQILSEMNCMDMSPVHKRLK